MPYQPKYYIRVNKKKQQAVRRMLAASKIQSAFRKKQSLNSRIKKISLANSETKSVSQYERSATLFHNVTHYVPNLLFSQQGVTNNPGTTEQDNRLGNEVVARGLKLQLQFITAPQRPNFNVRFYVFRYESGDSLSDGMFWCGPQGAGADMNRMIDFPHTNNVTILKTFTIQNRNTIYTGDTINSVHNTYRDVWIPFNNRKIKYVETNDGNPKFTTIGMCAVAYDANNSLETDALAYWSYTTKFYFKDP